MLPCCNDYVGLISYCGAIIQRTRENKEGKNIIFPWFKHILFRRKGLGAAYNATMPSPYFLDYIPGLKYFPGQYHS